MILNFKNFNYYCYCINGQANIGEIFTNNRKWEYEKKTKYNKLFIVNMKNVSRRMGRKGRWEDWNVSFEKKGTHSVMIRK